MEGKAWALKDVALTLPSRGRPTSSFACCRPPLMSNVRRHMDIERIRKIAHRVRRAIESISPEDLPSTFSNFPRGACGDGCLLLGTYLEEKCGLPTFDYICGERGTREEGTWTSHAWLQLGELVVDI